jgi:hypothetical protein
MFTKVIVLALVGLSIVSVYQAVVIMAELTKVMKG